jgi:hypothetical protein
MPRQTKSWYIRLLDLCPPALSVAGGIGYFLMAQYSNRMDYIQAGYFNTISILTLACLVGGILSGVVSLRFCSESPSHRIKEVLWLCLPAILLVTSFATGSLLVKSVLSPCNMCMNNVRRIEVAKAEWAHRTGATNGAVVNWSDIASNFTNVIPKCPEGGVYRLGRIGEEAACSNPKHQITP